ncbi:hypothetical protein AVEN_190137-1 [Araneus ventricosus]|uniref:Uncharacterized protein n=1 Tax=Araneus ventricosus TaxID=182803 RepID=A0A4Y2SHR8_ARAVE|nr:hypothetical protein AVEN_190137-1 [Araneus ventricosus]
MHHLLEARRWRGIGRLEVNGKQKEVAKWLKVSLSQTFATISNCNFCVREGQPRTAESHWKDNSNVCVCRGLHEIGMYSRRAATCVYRRKRRLGEAR